MQKCVHFGIFVRTDSGCDTTEVSNGVKAFSGENLRPDFVGYTFSMKRYEQ